MAETEMGMSEARWAKHYSWNHQILLVGEGDFSFSLSLATSFRSASNIVATSLDSYDEVTKKYKNGKSNLELLSKFGAQVLHGVDAISMKLHTDLCMRKFDRIIYNFPHAGFLGRESNHWVISVHRNLVRGFFKNASGMLRPNGEVHVTHKTNKPFCTWNIEQLAAESLLALHECVKFDVIDYPGYNVKRGEGRRCDDPFPLGICTTFKFVLSSTKRKPTHSHHHRYIQEIPLQRRNERIVVDPTHPVRNSRECFRIFREYFNHARLTFGVADDHLIYSFPDMLQTGFERFMAESNEKPLHGYINLLEELWYISKQRIAHLKSQVLAINHHHTL